MGWVKGVQGLGPIALAAKIDSALGRAHARLARLSMEKGYSSTYLPQ